MVSESTTDDAKSAASGAAKTGGGILGIGGATDVAEGNGLDKLAGAANEAMNGLEVAADMAGGVLRDIFGGLPWNMSGQEVSGAVSDGTVVATDIVLSLL